MSSESNGEGESAQTSDRARTALRRVPAVVWVAAVAVVLLGLWAATSIGQRPSLGSGSSHDDGATAGQDPADTRDPTGPGSSSGGSPAGSSSRFSPAAPALPSAGCATDAGGDATKDATLVVDGTEIARYSTEEGGPAASGGAGGAADPSSATGEPEPAPLLVLVSEPGVAASVLADESGLFDVAAGWVRLAVDPLVDGEQLGSSGTVPLLEKAIAQNCVDLNRVFVVGFGDGARAAAAAACSAPELLTGVAMVAGSAEPACAPDPHVAVRLVGASDDPGVDTGTALEELGSAWAESVGADGMLVDGRDEETVVRSWSGDDGVTVETTTTVSGGHAWSVAASLAVGTFLTDTARSLR